MRPPLRGSANKTMWLRLSFVVSFVLTPGSWMLGGEWEQGIDSKQGLSEKSPVSSATQSLGLFVITGLPSIS